MAIAVTLCLDTEAAAQVESLCPTYQIKDMITA
jgi:hypothetical protein